MSTNPLPVTPDPWSGITYAPEQAAGPIVRHVGRDMPSKWPAVDLSDPHWLPSSPRGPSIVTQAWEIFDHILNDPDPRLAENRQRLRAWVDTYPRSPDRALLEHLIETRSQTNSLRQPDHAAAPVVVHRAVAH